jgi:hypothetical protein
MPAAQEFLNGFGLVEGKKLAGYTLTAAEATELSVKRYQEYHYDITLAFRNDGYGTYENLYYSLHPYLTLEHIIYGVKNPYRCIIDEPKDGDVDILRDNTIIFRLIGHAYRSHH